MPIVTEFPAVWTDSIAVDKIDGKLYKVSKVNPKNIKCIAQNGSLWNVAASRLRAATQEEQQVWKDSQPEVKLDQIARLGSVVRFTGNYALKHGTSPMVVIKEKAGDLVSLVRLGGDVQRRYFPSVPVQVIEFVNGEITVQNV